MSTKIQDSHLNKTACIYLRQSTMSQVRNNQESTERQYALREKALNLGWSKQKIRIMDGDLGMSGATSEERKDFKALVAEVSMQKVGAVFALEASRLARSSTDWHRLLELCVHTNTLIIDEDGCYNPQDFNDQLLLGLKGTMSQAELHFLRARLQGGILNKAKKGELKSTLPAGYCHAEDGMIILDPDEQVREAVKLVFETFKRVGTANGVVRELAKLKLQFPKRQYGGIWNGQLKWGRLTFCRVISILKNPCYAGVYVYGRYSLTKRLTEDGKITTNRVVKSIDECSVVIKDHHEKYISFDEYNRNQKTLQINSPRKMDMQMSVAREGLAILQGLMICGTCGRRLCSRYKTKSTGIYPSYHCTWMQREGLAPACMVIPAAPIDKAVTERILEIVNRDQLKISLSALEHLEQRDTTISKQWQMKIERANYEAQLAQKRYEEVDPSNRLVASTLESRWNDALECLEITRQQAIEQSEMITTKITSEQKVQILKLAKDLPKLWKAESTKPQDKKRILRLLISDITAERQSGATHVLLHVRWKSGATEDIEIELPIPITERRKYKLSVIERIRKLAKTKTDSEIAEALNKEGVRSPGERDFSKSIVSWVRHRYNILAMNSKRDNELVIDEVVQKFGITRHVVYYWIERGQINARKDCSGRFLFDLNSSDEAHLRKLASIYKKNKK